MKFDAIETSPMFDITPPPRPRPAPKAERFGPRTIRRITCPFGAHTAALIVGDGEHLVWRAHVIRVGVASWPCRASLKDLCEVPATSGGSSQHVPTCADPIPGEWSW